MKNFENIKVTIAFYQWSRKNWVSGIRVYFLFTSKNNIFPVLLLTKIIFILVAFGSGPTKFYKKNNHTFLFILRI